MGLGLPWLRRVKSKHRDHGLGYHKGKDRSAGTADSSRTAAEQQQNSSRTAAEQQQNSRQQTDSRQQRAESREQRAESREQRAESREQRAESREQRAESREQRAESREQRARTTAVEGLHVDHVLARRRLECTRHNHCQGSNTHMHMRPQTRARPATRNRYANASTKNVRAPNGMDKLQEMLNVMARGVCDCVFGFHGQ